MTLPDFDNFGNLPPGEHLVSWTEFTARYGYNTHRAAILDAIKAWLAHIQAAGCRTAWIDGSFVCKKEIPGDYDACWDVTGVSHRIIDPALLDLSDTGKDRIQAVYGGDIRPDRASPPASTASYLNFFQRDRMGRPKGIIKLDLRSLNL
jgi:hypothetical protein